MKAKAIIRSVLKECLPYGIVKNIVYIPPISEGQPLELYNKYGERMKEIYLSSYGTQHHPYQLHACRQPRQILWNRQNYALDTHFYAGPNVFKMIDNDSKKFAYQAESEAIIPDVYKKIENNIEYWKSAVVKFFTHSERLLDELPNALLIPASHVWYGSPLQGGEMTPDKYKTKTRTVSIVSSIKASTPLHQFRVDTAKYMLQEKIGDVYGKIVNNYIPLADAFDDYMFTVAIENNQTKYYFTEKILNCFASMTVPIYCGATAIGEFFNTDGIIIIKEPTMEAIKEALAQCTRENYESRLEAIKDNYERVQEYICFEDYLVKHYGQYFM